MPLALRQRKPQAIIQKEGRCEEDQPSRAQRKLRVHRKCINKRYAARERCATIPTSTPLHRAPRVVQHDRRAHATALHCLLIIRFPYLVSLGQALSERVRFLETQPLN